MKRYLFLGLLIIVLSACSIASPELSCYEQSKDYVEKMDLILQKWDDSQSVAKSTSRIALSPMVANMQSIRREAQNLEVPECAQDAQDRFIQYTDYTINGFLSFMADDNDKVVQSYFDTADMQFGYFIRAYQAIKSPTEK